MGQRTLTFGIDESVAEEIEFFAAMSGTSTDVFIHDLVNMGLNRVAQLPEYKAKAEEHLARQQATAERVIERCVRQNAFREAEQERERGFATSG